MRVIEIYPSIQGEGVAVGRPAIFVRFAGCNLKCDFCDTKYAWGEGVVDFPIEELVKEVYRHPEPVVVLTGGEPLQQSRYDLEKFCREIRAGGKEIHIETNGMNIDLDYASRLRPYISLWTISPKLHAVDWKYILEWFTIQVEWEPRLPIQFKFVIGGKDDIRKIRGLLDRIQEEVGRWPVMVSICGIEWAFQPEWSVWEEVFPNMAEWVREVIPGVYPKARFIPQVHKLVKQR